MKPPTPPPQFICTPRDWVGPTAISAPRSPGGRMTPRLTGSTPMIVSAPAARAIARDLRGAAFELAEIARRFDIDRGGAARDPGLQLLEVDSAGLLVMTEGDHVDMAAHLDGLAVIADDRESLGIDQPRQQHLMPAGEARGHADGMAGGAAPAVDRELDHIHLQQLAQLAGIFEPGLVAAMVRLGRAPDRGQEFGAPDDLVDHRRHVMLPAAGARGNSGSSRRSRCAPAW